MSVKSFMPWAVLFEKVTLTPSMLSKKFSRRHFSYFAQKVYTRWSFTHICMKISYHVFLREKKNHRFVIRSVIIISFFLSFFFFFFLTLSMLDRKIQKIWINQICSIGHSRNGFNLLPPGDNLNRLKAYCLKKKSIKISSICRLLISPRQYYFLSMRNADLNRYV